MSAWKQFFTQYTFFTHPAYWYGLVTGFFAGQIFVLLLFWLEKARTLK